MATIKIDSLEKKAKQDGRPYWVVKSNGVTYYCFDTKIGEKKVGDEIEVDVREKDTTDSQGNVSKWFYIQFPRENKSFGGPKVVNTNAMILAYAKDLEIAIMEKSKETKTLQQTLEEIQFIYETFKNLIGGEK